MKKTIASLVAALVTMGCAAQDIALPKVDMNEKSASVVETLAKRHSVREYSSKPLSLQQLSNLCWAACGVSRDAQHRTAPTAMNRKEIRLFVFTAEGAYEYLAADNMLKLVAKGDNRALLAGGAGFKQNFVLQAPVTLLMVLDFDLFRQNDEHARTMGCVDVGNVSENINLYCQSVGLCTVPRAMMDTEAIGKLLGLNANQVPVLNNPVGFPKE